MGYTRTRVDGGQTVWAGILTKFLNGNPIVTFDCGHFVPYSRMMTDVVTPGFSAIQRKGGLLVNPMTLSEVTRSSGGGSYYATQTAAPNDVYTTSGGSLTTYQLGLHGIAPPNSSISIDIDGMIAAAKAKALGGFDASPASFMEDTYELRSTLAYLKNPAKGFLDLAKGLAAKRAAARKRFAKDPQGLAKALTDIWLSYRFAFRPLVKSVGDGVALLTSGIPPNPVRKTTRGMEKDSQTVDETYNLYFNPWVFDTFKYYKKVDVTVRAGITYDTPAQDASLAWATGMRLKDVPETIWAIMPYSFMVDRVWNISQAIRGIQFFMSPHVLQSVAWLSVETIEEEYHQYLAQTNPGFSVSVSGDLVKTKTRVYDRQVWIPTVGDVIDSPNWGNLVKDATSIADLLALGYNYIIRS